MATTGPKFPGTAEDDASVGTVAWTNPGDVASDDASNATASLFVEQSHYLVARNFDFSSIPSGSTIDSIAVTIERDGSSGNVEDVIVKLWQSGPAGDNHASVGYWGGPAENIGYSGFGTWGLTLSRDDVNDADFGVCISVENDAGGAIPAIDFISMEITYTPPADVPAPAVSDSLGVVTSRRIASRLSPLTSSIGADDALIFADLPSETPLAGPGLLCVSRRRQAARRESYAGGFADNLTDELASLDASATLLFVSARLPQRRPVVSQIITNSPPPDESHSCGCVGSAVLVADGFATAKFVGSSAQPDAGGYSARIVEAGFTAIMVDDCDCEA